MPIKKKEHPVQKVKLHSRNKHRERYDFKELVNTCPELAQFVSLNIYEDESIDFSNPEAVKMLNRALLKHFYDIEYWDIPQNVKGRKIQYIKLTPISAKDPRKEILLGIDIQSKNIYNLIEVGKNSTKTTLTVNSFKTNQPLSKNQFIFEASKYPKYYINKLD